MNKEFIRTEKIIVKKDKQLIEWMTDSTHIYNSALYELRQSYFSCINNNIKIKTPSYIELYHICFNKNEFVKSSLDINIKQYIIKQAYNNWKAFIKSTIEYKKNYKKFKNKPKVPDFLEKDKLNLLIIDKTRLRKINLIDNSFCLPKSSYKIFISKRIDIKNICCVRILNYYTNKIKIEIIYKKYITIDNNLNVDNSLGIDLGINNLCSITSNNQNLSWIINGRIIKSINQYSNKLLSKHMTNLKICNHVGNSKKMEQIRMKRDNKINYYFYIVSNFIISLCLQNNIGNIIIGRNIDWKQKSNIGKRNNQNFNYIPYFKLINIIKYKAEEKGINVYLTDESYTSKIDHLILEEMKHHDLYQGKRIKRGLFKSSTGKLLNADINGAIGILRKKNAISDVDIINLRDRGDVVSPLMFPNKTHKEKYFK